MFHFEKHCNVMQFAFVRNSTGQWVLWTRNWKVTFGQIVLM